jgi:F-type H+-transporting ATPase subunit delta
VKQVNLVAKSGSMGILANHIPVVTQLSPGIVEIVGEKNLKYFGSG